MFTKMRACGVLLVAALSLPAAASAATIFDFAAVADAPTSTTVYGVAGGEKGATSFTFTNGGISVTTTGYNTATGAGYNAYLDSYSGGPGGLGVCEVMTSGNQCNPNTDDNVTYGESLKLVFSQAVTIDSTTFRNGDHKTNFSGNFNLQIDGGTVNTYSLANLFNTPITGTTFVFSNPNSGGGSYVSNDQQFYVKALSVNPVPVPAAAWLFASGLLGLVGVARRRHS